MRVRSLDIQFPCSRIQIENAVPLTFPAPDLQPEPDLQAEALPRQTKASAW